ncbi:MAG: hypothetical protein ABIH27_02100 [Candidatus Omnitrophota bacterium]
MAIIFNVINESASVRNLVVWDNSLYRMQFGNFRPEFSFWYDNWSDYFYLNNIKDIKIFFVKSDMSLRKIILDKKVILLTNKNNLNSIKDLLISGQIRIKWIGEKYAFLEQNV